MKGDRLALSGVNPFAGIAFVNTNFERMLSISTRRNKVQAMKPVSATAVELGISVLRLEGVDSARSCQRRWGVPGSGSASLSLNIDRARRRRLPENHQRSARVGSVPSTIVGPATSQVRSRTARIPVVAIAEVNVASLELVGRVVSRPRVENAMLEARELVGSGT